jgi:L-ribulose-5-phosphate 3-epimerase
MLKIISQWSMAGGGDGTLQPAQAMDQALAAGFDGVELAVALTGPITPETDQQTCEEIRAQAVRKKCVCETLASGMSWGLSPTHVDPEIRKKGITAHAQALQRAAWLGCRAMLFVPGAVKIPWDANYPPVPYAKAVDWAKDAIKHLADVAGQVNVDVCIENVWNGLFYSPLELAQVIDEIGSPCVGVYFDAGNLLGYHQHPPDWIRLLGKRIKRVHIKDFKHDVGGLNGFCDLLKGDMPWRDTMAALREIGYDSTIVAEVMPPDPTLLARTKAAMDAIFAM